MSKILVFGLQKSGKALFDLLKNENDVWLYDDNMDAIDMSWTEGKILDKATVSEAIKTFDILIYTPSISKSNWLILLAVKNNIFVFNEVEYCFSKLKNKSICVTGTDGKSTTVTMIKHILEASKINCKTCGNIGIPIASILRSVEHNDIIVAEVSSFMLSGEVGIHPTVSVVTNISQDHLDWHKSFKEYVFAKASITKFQAEEDYLIINSDDEVSSFLSWQTKAKTLFFSTQKKVEGAYQDGKNLYFKNEFNQAEKVMAICDLQITGEHNLSNALAAALACKSIGVSANDIAKGLSSFKGLKHRQEVVDEFCDTIFVNDSKGTTPKAVLAALSNYKNYCIGLILGGSSKNANFNEIFDYKKVFYYCFVGEVSQALSFSAIQHGICNYEIATNIKLATKILMDKMKDLNGKKAIILSPGCASFDMYKNFEERGEDFIKAVGALKNDICK